MLHRLPTYARNVRNPSPGFVETTLDISPLTEFTSYDTGIIMDILNTEVRDYAGDPLHGLQNVSLFSLVQVTLEGSTYRNRGNQTRRKVFKPIQVRSIGTMIHKLQDWSDGFIGPNVDYSMDIDTITLLFINNMGGCDDGIIKKEVGMYFQGYRYKKNNCFFWCLKNSGLLFHKNFTMNVNNCNIIRRRYGVEDNCMISRAIAERINRDECGNKIVIIEDNNWFKKNYIEKKVYIRLINNHYDLLIHAKKPEIKCATCGVSYVERHKCFGKRKREEDEERFIDLKDKTVKKPGISRVFHYDIETHSKNESKEHEPYVVGLYHSKKYDVFTGEDCMVEMVNFLVDTYGKKGSYILNAFNGANFDHYFLVRALLALKIPIKDFSLQNRGVVSGEFYGFKMWDICRHTTGSLKKNLKAWGCGVQKGDFDHTKGNKWHLMNEEDQKDCLIYLEKDVLGLRDLYEVMAEVVHDQYRVDIFDFLSASQLTFYGWAKKMEKAGEVIYLPSNAEKEIYQGSVYGGRTYPSKKKFESRQRQMFMDGITRFEDINDYVQDLDVVSLYPAAMLYNYPSGRSYELSEYICKKYNKMLANKEPIPFCIVYCEVTPNRLLQHAVIPSRRDIPNGQNGKLCWDLKYYKGWLTSIDINRAMRFGYKITIKKKGGRYWKKGSKLFEQYIRELYILKKNSKKGTPKYLLAKLMMNGLYGKMIQKPIIEKGQFIKTTGELFNFKKNNVLMEVEVFGDRQVYITGFPKSKKEQEKRNTKPTYLGAFILAYSRSIMMDYIVKSNPYFSDGCEESISNDFYYTDTDSIQVHIRNTVPTNKDIGGITDDLGDECKIIRGIWIAPKLYMLEYAIDNGKDPKKCDAETCNHGEGCNGMIHYHFRGKGVSSKSLSVEMFENMFDGESYKTSRDFSFKKIGPTRNSVEAEKYNRFSIIEKGPEDTVRILNNKPWKGRNFLSNGTSVPVYRTNSGRHRYQ